MQGSTISIQNSTIIPARSKFSSSASHLLVFLNPPLRQRNSTLMARFRGLVQDPPPPPPLAGRFCLLPQVEYRLLFAPALTLSIFAGIQLIFRRYRPAVREATSIDLNTAKSMYALPCLSQQPRSYPRCRLAYFRDGKRVALEDLVEGGGGVVRQG